MYILGVNYEYSVNILREYNNSTLIKRSGGETKRSSATGSALLQAFKTIFKTNTERTLPNKNEQKTNNENSISTWFELLCSVVRRGLWYTPVLMLTLAPRCPVRRFRAEARVTCRRKQGGHKSAHSARVTVTLKITQAKVFHSVGDGNDGKIAQGYVTVPRVT